MNRNLSEVEGYLSGSKLRRELQHDLEVFRIINEADFQSCLYYHLRQFFGRATGWRIYAEKSTPFGNIVDLVISQKSRDPEQGFKPRIAIELKQSRDHISLKDRNSLGRSLKELRVHKVYLFTVNYRGEVYTKIKKQPGEKYRFHEVEVRPSKGLSNDPTKWLGMRSRIKHNRDLSKRNLTDHS